MTCKDCLHYEPCKNGFLPFEFDEKVTCRSFANKAEWLHLPCEIGSTIYVDTETWGGLYKFCRPTYICGEAFAIATIVSITVTKRQKFIKLAVVTKSGKRIFSRYSFGSIGYTVFFTAEEAEKALAERRKK